MYKIFDLFLKRQIEKQHKYQFLKKWMNKMRYTHTMKYLAVKIHELELQSQY